MQVKIHIFDNPPLFAWAELSNAMFHGNRAHIRQLLLNRKFLQRHFERLEQLTASSVMPMVRNVTCLIKHPYGYFWEGGRSGMDNTPRGRIGQHAAGNRPNHPRMLWLDAVTQQGLVAYCIAELADCIEEKALAAEWRTKYEAIKELINRYYWHEQDECYYDIHADTQEHMKVMTIASFWPLQAAIPSSARAEKLIRHLRDPQKFGGTIPLVSLARDDADFNTDTGEYWRGSMWVPTAYMTIKGLEKYGHFELARETAGKVIEHMYRTFREYNPHTIWEAYNPSRPQPARSCDENNRIVRPDFCGWSALAPISLYLENVIGIHAVNAFHNTVEWQLDRNADGRIGMKNLVFGKVITDLVCNRGVCEVSSNLPYNLTVNNQSFAVKAGWNRFFLSEPAIAR